MMDTDKLRHAVDEYKDRAFPFNDDRPLSATCTVEELYRAVSATADLAKLFIEELEKASS